MRHTIPSVLLLATVATAQTPPHLVGLTAQMPAVIHRDQASCTNLSMCSPAGFPQTTGLPYAGGTGWDPILSGAWISNGPVIACVDDNCNYLCPMSPAPTPGIITGLEVVESLNEIWATDSLSNIVRMSRSCPPTFLSACNTGIVPTPTRGLSGLAVDEGRQLVFYSGADWSTGQNRLFVAPMSSPCTPFYNQPFTGTCAVPFRLCTGLAVDWGSRLLYLTDGMQTMAWSYVFTPTATIVFTPVSCCMQFQGDTYVGLAVRTGKAAPFGPPCAGGSCPTCPMQHALANDPNLGNGSFALALNGAPNGGLAFCLLTVGACASPGFPFPPLCGPLFVTTASLGTLGPVVATGGPGCGASAQFPLPLPAVPFLAGLPIASQCVVLCSGGGTSLSNCLSWVLQGN